MKIRISTIEEIAKVFLRIGEAAIIGSGASVFVTSVSIIQSFIGGIVGISLVLIGIYFHNISDLKGR